MEVAPQDQAFALVNGFRASQLVALAVEMELPERISREPATAGSLAQATGTHEPSLRRMLGALTALGVFEEDAQGGFHETAVSRCFLPGQPEHGMARMLVRESYAAFPKLVDAVRTGEPVFEQVHGMTRWEHLAKDPDAAARFNVAMAGTANLDGRALGAATDLSSVKTLVDVGGGRAALMASVLKENPRLHGIVFDLPAGLIGAMETLSAAGVADRCELVPGSFLEEIPGGHEAYSMRYILHDWDDAHCEKILATCARAMQPGSRLLLMERIRPEHYRSTPADLRVAMLDVQMLVVLGGRERSEQEYRELLRVAGLDLSRKTPLPTGTWLLEARKSS